MLSVLMQNLDKRSSKWRQKEYSFNIAYQNVKKKVLKSIFSKSCGFKLPKTTENI